MSGQETIQQRLKNVQFLLALEAERLETEEANARVSTDATDDETTIQAGEGWTSDPAWVKRGPDGKFGGGGGGGGAPGVDRMTRDVKTTDGKTVATAPAGAKLNDAAKAALKKNQTPVYDPSSSGKNPGPVLNHEAEALDHLAGDGGKNLDSLPPKAKEAIKNSAFGARAGEISATVREHLAKAGDDVVNAFDQGKKSIESLKNTDFQKLGEGAKKKMGDFAKGASDDALAGFGAGMTAAHSVLQFANNGLVAAGNGVRQVGKSAKEFAGHSSAKIGDMLNKGKDSAWGFANMIAGTSLAKKAASLMDAAGSKVSGAAKAIHKAGTDLINKGQYLLAKHTPGVDEIAEMAGIDIDGINSRLSSASAEVKSQVGGKLDEVKTHAMNMAKSIKEKAGDAKTSAVNLSTHAVAEASKGKEKIAKAGRDIQKMLGQQSSSDSSSSSTTDSAPAAKPAPTGKEQLAKAGSDIKNLFKNRNGTKTDAPSGSATA